MYVTFSSPYCFVIETNLLLLWIYSNLHVWETWSGDGCQSQLSVSSTAQFGFTICAALIEIVLMYLVANTITFGGHEAVCMGGRTHDK